VVYGEGVFLGESKMASKEFNITRCGSRFMSIYVRVPQLDGRSEE
jgi:hypothetical protein